MNKIHLSYLLYNIDEVVYSFMLSLLFKNKHSLNESLFWAHELYVSKYDTYLWNFITKLYYDFYYIKNTSFEKQIDKEYYAWKSSNSFQHIAKIIKELHKQNIDTTIFELINKGTNDMDITFKGVSASILKENISKTVCYLKQLNNDEIVELYKKLYRISKKDYCMFYTNKKHKWTVKLLNKLMKIRKAWVKTKFNSTDIGFIDKLDESPDRVYKTLRDKRMYGINKSIGSFELARFKEETDVVRVWNETTHKYMYDDNERFKAAYLHYWEYYARETPFWKEVFDAYKIKFNKRTIQFTSIEDQDKFYDEYGFEPDEQSIETQNKSIKNVEETTISDCFKSYGITLEHEISQINYIKLI